MKSEHPSHHIFFICSLLCASSHRLDMYPERQDFGAGVVAEKLNLWWKETPQLETAFRRRLGNFIHSFIISTLMSYCVHPSLISLKGQARQFEESRVWNDGYVKGNSRGGGGKHGGTRFVKLKVRHDKIFGRGVG